MTPLDPIVFRELPVIHKIIEDETWLEGERRGRQVASDDPVVRENVCQVILRIGQQLRDSLRQAMEETGPRKNAEQNVSPGPAAATDRAA